jgi:putative Mg2+ transporter-C (MgtC) family protein
MDLTWLDRAQFQILFEVIIAMILGGAIGFEREIASRPAGLRTHMLVAGAACLFVALGDHMVRNFDTTLGSGLVQSDPIRIIQAVLIGISFLGAGTIVRRQEEGIEGLTTAASILVAAGIGVASALDLWIISVGITVLTLLILGGVRILERSLVSRRKGFHPPED